MWFVHLVSYWGEGGGVVVDKNFTFSIQNSWVAKSLMNHTFAVKVEDFKHASHKMHLTYWTEVFRRHLSFKARSHS